MNKTSKLKPTFKINGDKYHLCEWIIQHFPENYEEMVYLEPFCGSASTLINKAVSFEEAINDIDQGVVKIMRTIRDQCKEFTDSLRKVKYTKEIFDKALEQKEFTSDLDKSVNEFILRRMSKGGLKEVFLYHTTANRQKSWDLSIKQMSKIAKRIEHVYIFNKPAIEVLNAFNKANTLAYVDPPAPDETSELQHSKLSDLLKAYKGKVIVSGHPSTLYNRLYKPWRVEKKKSTTKTALPECLWMNY